MPLAVSLGHFSSSFSWVALIAAMLSASVRSVTAQQQTDSGAGSPNQLVQRAKLSQHRAYQEQRKAFEAQMKTTAQQIEPVHKTLDSLLALCLQRRLPTDYERVVANLLLAAPEYGGYTPELKTAATNAVDRLRAYLAGTATPFSAPRYTTQKLRIRGYEFLGDMKYPDGRVARDRPMYLIGYGHGYMVYPDIKNFAGYGTDLLQVSTIGPRSTVFEAGTADWQVSQASNDDNWFRIDSTVAHGGRRSMVVHNNLRNVTAPSAFFRVHTQRGATYQITAWVKAKDANGASLGVIPFVGTWPRKPGSGADTVLPAGSYEWRKVEFPFTATSEFMDVVLELAGPTDKLWLDDIRVTPQATARPGRTKDNLMPNGDFERMPPVVPGYNFYSVAVDDRSGISSVYERGRRA